MSTPDDEKVVQLPKEREASAELPATPGEVVMLETAQNPDCAISFIQEALARDPAPRGIIVTVVDPYGNDTRVFGIVRRYEMSYAGSVLTCQSVYGDFELEVLPEDEGEDA